MICPDCAFTFDQVHEDETGGYSCPLCEVVRAEEERDELERLAFEANEREKGLEQQIVRAEEALREIAQLVRHEWRLKHHEPGFVLSTIEQVLVAAVPEKDKP